MQEKKKIKNKENFQPIKKTTIQQINYTEQLRIPTLNTIDLKNFGKSIELKKQKKPASRKSRCVSVKQTCTSVKQTTTQPIKYKQLLKQFQELKLLQDKSKSKQKSSKSSLSQSKRKSNSRKYNLITLMTKSNSRPSYCNSQFNLTQKLQKTLKKFNETDYFKDEDELIPFVSTSQPYMDQQLKNYEISNINNQEEINILEMRKFCRHKEQQYTDNEFSFKRNIQYFKGDQYEMMAIKIQRAWRQYRTKKLVEQYAGLYYQQQDSEDYLLNYGNHNNNPSNNSAQNIIESDKKNIMNKARYLEGQQSDSYELQNQQQSQKLRKRNYEKEGVIKTSQLYLPYELQQQQHKITYISNLEQSSQGEHKEQDFDLDLNLNQKLKLAEQHHDQQQKQYEQQNNYEFNHENQLRTSYEQIINQIKKKQLIKWNQVIQLLSSNKSNSDPKRLQQLLQTLAFQSEKNKKELQFKTEELLQQYHEKDRIEKWNHQSKYGYPQQCFQLQKSQGQENNQYLNHFQLSNNKEKQKEKRKQRQIQRQGLWQRDQLLGQKNNYKQESGPSQLSDFKKQEEFDSRKYIQYLDSDMFNIDRQRSSDNSSGLNNDERFSKKISKRKQQQLLATLQYEDIPLRLGKHSYSKSQCLQYSIQQSSIRSKNFMRLSKSNSQKNIDKAIKSISPNLMNYDRFQNERQIDSLNIDLIRRQFLQNADPLDQLERLHKQDQLRIKICETLQEYSINNQNKQETQKIQYSRDHQKDFQPQRAVTHIDLSKTKVENSSKDLTGISVQQIDKNISSSDESEDDEEDQKVSNVSFMIFNFLVFQLLKEMAVHDSILDMFKSYSLKQKIKNKKDDQKKGFSTTHHEVKSFVQSLVDYLLNEQPQVFKNLQVSAGPSALQMLHYMHPCQQQESIINQSQDDQSAVMVIPNRIFQTYWKIKQKSLLFQNKDPKIAPQILIRRKQNFEYIKGFNKIFCRSIFDTFNECLDFQRNFGQAGKPFPWKKTPSFFHNKALSEINKSIQNSQKKIMEISMTYCGIIIEPSDMGKMSIEEGEQYLQHVQEDRMSRMLAQDLVEGQQKWTFYDDQQTEILVEIGNTLAMELLFEACTQIEELGFFF